MHLISPLLLHDDYFNLFVVPSRACVILSWTWCWLSTRRR
jgi:hypothetical protein